MTGQVMAASLDKQQVLRHRQSFAPCSCLPWIMAGWSLPIQVLEHSPEYLKAILKERTSMTSLQDHEVVSSSRSHDVPGTLTSLTFSWYHGMVLMLLVVPSRSGLGDMEGAS